MQERYLGDSHDFVKYALLRQLSCKLGMRVGLNWYLTRPQDVDRPGSKDGEKRHHLSGGVWSAWDSELLDQLRCFQDGSVRRLSNFESMNILPAGTLFFGQAVPTCDRIDWHNQATCALASADLIFLDPDNGFEVESMRKRTTPKYALYSEAVDYYRMGKSVISVQFARQCDPYKRATEVRKRLYAAAGAEAELPVARAHLAPNILFVTLSPRAHFNHLARALSNFACQSQNKVELIGGAS